MISIDTLLGDKLRPRYADTDEAVREQLAALDRAQSLLEAEHRTLGARVATLETEVLRLVSEAGHAKSALSAELRDLEARMATVAERLGARQEPEGLMALLEKKRLLTEQCKELEHEDTLRAKAASMQSALEGERLDDAQTILRELEALAPKHDTVLGLRRQLVTMIKTRLNA